MTASPVVVLLPLRTGNDRENTLSVDGRNSKRLQQQGHGECTPGCVTPSSSLRPLRALLNSSIPVKRGPPIVVPFSGVQDEKGSPSLGSGTRSYNLLLNRTYLIL